MSKEGQDHYKINFLKVRKEKKISVRFFSEDWCDNGCERRDQKGRTTVRNQKACLSEQSVSDETPGPQGVSDSQVIFTYGNPG